MAEHKIFYGATCSCGWKTYGDKEKVYPECDEHTQEEDDPDPHEDCPACQTMEGGLTH